MILSQVKEGADLIKGVTESAPVLAAFIIIVIAFLVFLFMLLKADRDDRSKRELAAETRELERERREKERDKAFIEGMAQAGVACHEAQKYQSEKYERLVQQNQAVTDRNTQAHQENTHATRELREIARRLEEKL